MRRQRGQEKDEGDERQRLLDINKQRRNPELAFSSHCNAISTLASATDEAETYIHQG